MQDVYYWSPTEKAFYSESMRSMYEKAHSWPSDAREVSNAVWEEYGAKAPPVGYMRDVGFEGMPVWRKLPEPGKVQPFLIEVISRRAKAIETMLTRYLIENKRVPEAWVTYFKALEAILKLQNLDDDNLPPLPSTPAVD